MTETPPEPPRLGDVLQTQLGNMRVIIRQLSGVSPLQVAGPSPRDLESMLLAEVAATVMVLTEAMIVIDERNWQQREYEAAVAKQNAEVTRVLGLANDGVMNIDDFRKKFGGK